MATAPPILIWQPGGGVPVGPISSGGPVYSQAGTTALIQGQAYVDVVFGSVQTDDEWVLVECIVVNEIDVEPLNIWPGIITDKASSGFRIYLNGLPDSGNYYLHWAVSGVNIAPSPATNYQFTGPASGGLGVASTFTVSLPPSTTLSGTLTVSPNDGGAGGAFSPTSVTLSTTTASATFTYTPASYGAKTLSVTNSGTLSNPASIAFTVVASTYTLSGPSGGTAGVPSTNFTVALPGGSSVIGTVTVTPADGGGSGSFTPTTVGLTTGAPSATFTYTPASTGAKTISVTNNGGLTNPGNLTYTATAPVHHRSLTVDHTKVPSTQTDFPVLVSITDVTLKTIANGGHVVRSDGFDIGFYSDSGLTTKLKWEIEKYDPATGELVAWIKIASLSSSVDTVFYVGYGDTSITTDQSDKLNVWTNSFTAVYHLGNGTTLSVADSLNVANGTNVNAVTAVTGKVDGGANFASASTQYVDLGSQGGAVAVSVSCWVKATSFPAAYNAVISRNNPGVATTQVLVKSSGKLYVGVSTSGGAVAYDGTGTITLSTGTWYHVAATYDSVAGLIGYVNGGVDGTIAALGTHATPAVPTRIASDPGTAGREWNGALDEMRVASVARSANWITTEYNNQNAPGTFITLGTEV